MAAAVAQVEATGPVRGKPVLILSRWVPPSATPTDALWAAAQKELAARYPGSRHLVAPGGTHTIHLTQREWFVSAIQVFLKEARLPQRRWTVSQALVAPKVGVMRKLALPAR